MHSKVSSLNSDDYHRYRGYKVKKFVDRRLMIALLMSQVLTGSLLQAFEGRGVWPDQDRVNSH